MNLLINKGVMLYQPSFGSMTRVQRAISWISSC